MRAGKLLKLAAPGYVSSHAEHLQNDITVTLNVLLDTAETLNEKLAAVDADAKLSPQGKLDASSRVAAAALATLDAIEATTIKGLTDHAASIQASMLNKLAHTLPKDPAERNTYESHLREIRDQLRELPMAERANVYRSTTDPLVIAAIDTAPLTLSAKRPDGSRQLEPFVPEAERTAASIERAERADPSTAARLHEVQSVRQVYTLAVNGLRTEILAEVPDAAPAPVPTMR